jgi:branched-chain amino acid transport system ATP-binding protein
MEDMTVLENVRLAAQSRLASSMSFLRSARRAPAPIEGAMEAMRRVGIEHLAQEVAGGLSHGGQRQLEIAMLLATQPRVLLLDEPTAGMSRIESRALTELLRQLKADHTILLIEHDMQVVFDIADNVTVMTDGTVLASGRPDEIRNNANVRAAYLGERSARARAG